MPFRNYKMFQSRFLKDVSSHGEQDTLCLLAAILFTNPLPLSIPMTIMEKQVFKVHLHFWKPESMV